MQSVTGPDPLRQQAANVVSASPYLAGVVGRHWDWIARAYTAPTSLQGIFDPIDHDDIACDLRRRKQRVAGLLGLAETTGALSVLEATRQLTKFADFAVETVFKAHLQRFVAAGKLPERTGLFVLAMGKMGAFELNYSSDIDLIVMFDDTILERADVANVRSILNRVTRAAVKTLSEITGDGYVFRTDLRLRPDPSVTPVCVPVTQALTYYESLGRTWERAAFIKARVCAGDMASGGGFLNQMVPFVWRRHLDFAAIEDAYSLVQKIRAQNVGKVRIELPGHNLKLGRGGIREIEFFTQTRQLTAGGRDASLRDPATLDALQALTNAGWVEPADQADLQAAYLSLRHSEHAIQMVRDAQTASVPFSEEGIERVAALRGQTPDEFEAETLHHLHRVKQITDQFFEKDTQHTGATEPEQGLSQRMARWNTFRAFRSDRAVRLFEKLAPTISEKLNFAGDPETAWQSFEVFLENLPAGVQLFSLFYENPKLIDLVTEIVGASPDLGQHLARNASVLDAVIAGNFFGALPTQDEYQNALRDHIGCDGDFEDALDRARIWQKEAHFRICVQFLQGQIAADQVGQSFADLGRAVLSVMLSVVRTEFSRRYGHIPNSQLAVVSMGSLATGRMTARSDLDLLLIFDADPDAVSDGKRMLATRQYFGRLTQMLVSAISAPTSKGRLYEVDMRLRPSGRSGPVALRFESFAEYQMNEAWTWEHLVLTQAKPVAGDAALCAKIQNCKCSVLAAKQGWDQVKDGWIFMLDKLDELPVTNPSNVKTGAGGLQRIELLLQSACLAAGTELTSMTQAVDTAQTLVSKPDGLLGAWTKLYRLQQCYRLLNASDDEFRVEGDAGWNFINRHCGIPDQSRLDRVVAQSRETAQKIEFDLRKG